MKTIFIILGIFVGFVTTVHASAGSWFIQDSTKLGLAHIRFVDDANGWIFSESDTVLHTVDGGLSWQLQSTGSDYMVTDVQFLDAQTGYAVGDLGIVLKTTDGGENWVELNTELYDLLVSVCFLDNQNGWVVGEGGLIAKTTDGGATWESQIFPNEETEHQVVKFADSQNGWIAGALEEGAHVLRTTDGGVTWNTVLHDTTYGPMKSIEFVDAQNGWIAGMAGVILHTTDGGLNWQLQHQGQDGEQIRQMKFQNAQTGWAIGVSNAMLFTENAGADWYLLSVPTKKKVVDLCFSSPENGWAITSIGGGSGGKGDGGGDDGGDEGGEEGGDAEKISLILKWTPETGVAENGVANPLPTESVLYTNYPNPFNPATTLSYALSGSIGSEVSLVIYNELGQIVRMLVREFQTPGTYQVVWNGTDDFGACVSSGIYFYQIQAGDFQQTRKMLILY